MKTDITEIKNRLHGRVSQVCERLFPAGKAKGNKFYVGDIDGTPGKSLVVDLNGPNVGVWGDFAMGTGGDIIDLWRLARRWVLERPLMRPESLLVWRIQCSSVQPCRNLLNRLCRRQMERPTKARSGMSI